MKINNIEITQTVDAKGNPFEIVTIGEPSFNNLEKWEKEALINPLLEVIKDFYKDPENRQAYEKWKANLDRDK